MFTIKFYKDDGFRQMILEADSFTILRSEGGDAEITLHRGPGPTGEYRDERVDVKSEDGVPLGFPQCFDKAIIENANGKTTEVISRYRGPRVFSKGEVCGSSMPIAA